MNNTIPTYSAIPARSIADPSRIIPNRFQILEHRNGEIDKICEMSNRGDRLNNLLKRGIPMNQARILFYQMDGE